MNYANYSTLKGKSKQAFKKIAAVAEVKDTFNADGSLKKIGTSGEEAYRHGRSAIDRARHGQLVSAYKEGKQAYAGAKKTRKEIEAIRK